MGTIGTPAAVRLFCGVLSRDPDLLCLAADRLSEMYGPIDLRSEVLAFDFTDYYEQTMGSGLQRQFFAFSRLVDPSGLPDVKRATNRLESEFAESRAGDVERPVNLDPGYVTPAKVVLASTKNFAHRIYLRDGIYAEIALRYQGKQWVPERWTYPDYRTEAYKEFFVRVRAPLLQARADKTASR